MSSNKKPICITTRIAATAALSVAAWLSACGGGGGGGEAPAIDQMSTASQDRAFAIKLATVMVVHGPYSPTWIILPYGPSYLRETYVTGIATVPCVTQSITNADGVLNAGDRNEVRRTACTERHGTGGTLTETSTMLNTLEAISSPAVIEGTTWSASFNIEASGTVNHSFTQGSGLTFDGNSTRTRRESNTVSRVGDTQTDITVFTATHKETSTRGASDFTVSATMTCVHVVSTRAGQCDSYSALLSGTIHGRAVTATFTPSATDPKVATLNYGGVNMTVRAISQGSPRYRDTFSLTTAAGETINFTGEDVNWLAL